MSLAAAGLALATSGAGCGGAAMRQPGELEARSAYYADNSGLDVVTVAAAAEHPVSDRVAASARALVNYVSVSREPLDPGDPGAGHDPGGHPPHAPDAVTSASSLAKGGAVAEKFRFEGMAGASVQLGRDVPWTVGGSLRASHEPDYAAVSGVVGGNVELFDRNLTAGGFVGYGRDRVSPVEAPPGEEEAWPASHQRWQVGASLSQVVTPRIVVSAAAALSRQSGQLASPYRRALVRTTLFPEVVPDARRRETGFVAASIYVGRGAALHLRQGAYHDDWGVRALVPEAAVAASLGGRGLAWLRYQFYEQWAADFYEARYMDLEPLMTGDARLGPIRAHAAALGARMRVAGREGEPGELTGEISYELSLTDYRLYSTALIVAHVPVVGLTWSY